MHSKIQSRSRATGFLHLPSLAEISSGLVRRRHIKVRSNRKSRALIVVRASADAGAEEEDDKEAPSDESPVLKQYGSEDFELVRQLGTITVKEMFEVRDSSQLLGNPTLVDANLGEGQKQVNFYSARYYENALSQPKPVLLKEYPGNTSSLALNEIRVYERLLGAFPSDMDEPGFRLEADSLMKREAPVAAVLGVFSSLSVDMTAEEDEFGNIDEFEISKSTVQENALWIVQRWEPPLTLAACPGAVSVGPALSPRVTPMQLLTRKKFTEQEISAYQKSLKFDFIRIVLQQSMEALAFCHARSVVHRSLSSSSILLTTHKLDEAGKLEVYLTNFGTGVDMSRGLDALGSSFLNMALDAGIRNPMEIATLARNEDTHALGLALTEFVFSMLSKSGPSERTAANSLERIMEGLFQLDVDEMREYFAAEDEWMDVIEFLDFKRDDQSGWNLIVSMLSRQEAIDTILNECSSLFESGWVDTVVE